MKLKRRRNIVYFHELLAAFELFLIILRSVTKKTFSSPYNYVIVKLQRSEKERMKLSDSSMFNAKQLIKESKGNNAFLKRLVREELVSTPYPINQLIEATEDEFRRLKEERNWFLFWMTMIIILTLYLNLMIQDMLIPSFHILVCNTGVILEILLLGFYFKKNALLLSYDTVLSVLKNVQQNQLKAIRLSSIYLDPQQFYQDFLKKIELYGGDCKCYIYYHITDENTQYTGYALCEDEIWNPHQDEKCETSDKLGVMTTTLQNAYDLFKSQIKKSH